MFYSSLFGIVAMLLFRMGRGVVSADNTGAGSDLGLSAVGAPVVHKLTVARHVMSARVKLFTLAVVKALLEHCLSFYKKGGVMLLRVKDRVSRAGKEKKLGASANVSNYIKDVLDHKETLRNGNGPKSN